MMNSLRNNSTKNFLWKRNLVSFVCRSLSSRCTDGLRTTGQSSPAILQDTLQQEEHAASIDPYAYHFLCETLIDRKRQIRVRKGDMNISLWNYIQSYAKESYAEKSVLMDPPLAKEIADAIEEHSDRGPNTVLMDADGGFCYVTQRLLERKVFSRAQVFLKDINLEPLHSRAIREYLAPFRENVTFKQLNLVQIVPDFYANGGEYLSPLYEEQRDDSDWLKKDPPYTLFGTVTHSVVKYLTQRCLQRESLPSEFFRGRPEFFLVVSARTWIHMNSNQLQKATFRPLNILFQLTFDYKFIKSLTRSSFFPWRKLKQHRDHCLAKKYAENEDCFFLIKLRPKTDIGLSENVTAEHLEFFVHSLFRNKDVRLIPLMEKWLPGIGLDFVKAGFSIYYTTGDIPAKDIVMLLNILANHKDFQLSNFLPQAELFHKSRLNREQGSSKEVEEVLIKFRRDYGVDD